MTVARRSTFGSDHGREYGRVLRNGIPKSELMKIGREDAEELKPGGVCPTCNRPTPGLALPDGWRMNHELRALQNGRQVVLFSDREWDVLAVLASVPGKLWSRQMLIAEIWDGWSTSSNPVVVVARLRARLQSAGLDPSLVETVGGKNTVRSSYRLRLEGE